MNINATPKIEENGILGLMKQVRGFKKEGEEILNRQISHEWMILN